MNSEYRAHFEAELLKELKVVASRFDGVSASKNKLKFKRNKKNVAELTFDYLARVDSYVLVGLVNGGDIWECSSAFAPPYRSNLFNDGCFSFISSGEQNKRFSLDLSGAIKIPRPDLVREVCGHIRGVLEEFYIPKILGCIVPTERTISDVIAAPDEYAYPAVFIHCAAKLDGAIVSKSLLNEAINSKKIVKDKSYDLPLLAAVE